MYLTWLWTSLHHIILINCWHFNIYEHDKFHAQLSRAPLFVDSTQLSMKFILLINVKMPTIVGILTLISIINTTSERLKTRHFFICWYFSFMTSWNFMLSWVEHEKKFLNSRPGLATMIISDGKVPTDWEHSLIVCLNKDKGDTLDGGSSWPNKYATKILERIVS